MKTLTFTMEDALISLKGLAILTGADLIHAGMDEADKPTISAHTTIQDEAIADNNISFKVAHDIDDSRALYIMKLDGNGEMSGVPVKVLKDGTTGAISTYNYNAGTLTITSNLIKKGDVIFVDFYQLYKEDAVQIDITPDKFGGYFYLEGSTLFKRELDGKDLPAEIIIPKIKIQSNFTFTLASSGDPSTFTFTMDAFPDYIEGNKTKKVLCSIQVLEADDNYDAGDVVETKPTYARVTYDKDINSDPNNEGAYYAKKFGSEYEAQTVNDTTNEGHTPIDEAKVGE